MLFMLSFGRLYSWIRVMEPNENETVASRKDVVKDIESKANLLTTITGVPISLQIRWADKLPEPCWMVRYIFNLSKFGLTNAWSFEYKWSNKLGLDSIVKKPRCALSREIKYITSCNQRRNVELCWLKEELSKETDKERFDWCYESLVETNAKIKEYEVILESNQQAFTEITEKLNRYKMKETCEETLPKNEVKEVVNKL